VPGVAIGIYENGVITSRGLGVINIEDPLPVTDHTVFPIVSISKTFAATMVMRLAERGKIDLKAPVRTYLPDFKVRDQAVSREATVWNLLTHTAGWEGQVSGAERGEDTLRNFTAAVMPDLMQVAPFDYAQGRPPAAVWSYNNAGFSVSGRVIEAVTGTPINRAVRDLVFTPLGLEHAGTTAGEFIVNRFAAGHSSRSDAAATLQRPFSPSVSVTAGGIGLCITDLLNYAKFHLGDGTAPNGDRLLSRASLEAMRTTQSPKQGTDDDIGIAHEFDRLAAVVAFGDHGAVGPEEGNWYDRPWVAAVRDLLDDESSAVHANRHRIHRAQVAADVRSDVRLLGERFDVRQSFDQPAMRDRVVLWERRAVILL